MSYVNKAQQWEQRAAKKQGVLLPAWALERCHGGAGRGGGAGAAYHHLLGVALEDLGQQEVKRSLPGEGHFLLPCAVSLDVQVVPPPKVRLELRLEVLGQPIEAEGVHLAEQVPNLGGDGRTAEEPPPLRDKLLARLGADNLETEPRRRSKGGGGDEWHGANIFGRRKRWAQEGRGGT